MMHRNAKGTRRRLAGQGTGVPCCGRLTEKWFPNGINAQYAYDPAGRRIRKTVNGMTVNYLGLRLDAEEEFNGADLTIHQVSASSERETLW